MWCIIVTVASVVLGVSCTTMNNYDENGKVIVILIDGCRWDYVNDPQLKGFSKLAKNGIKAEYVKPVFPANSYPNSYSIATGLYPESHGFVQNIMYDEELEEFFLMLPRPNSTHSHWWEQAEPIWVNAIRNNVTTAMYWWPGCQVTIHGITPTLCLKHTGGSRNDTPDVMDKIGDILNKFDRNEIRLAMLYYGLVDYNGHYDGPDSPERKQALVEIDGVIDELQDQISQRGLSNQINIVIVSDHGMTNTDAVKEINLELFANDIKYMMVKGSTSMILPEDGKMDQLYNDLKNANITGLQIYKKEDIPERYHFKNNRLVLPIFLMANKGYYIKKLSSYSKTQDNSTTIHPGNHGYDEDEVHDMRAIFYARGPALRKDYTSPPLENVDHYNLICSILGLTPRPNNGSWDRIKEMFLQSDPTSNDGA